MTSLAKGVGQFVESGLLLPYQQHLNQWLQRIRRRYWSCGEISGKLDSFQAVLDNNTVKGIIRQYNKLKAAAGEFRSSSAAPDPVHLARQALKGKSARAGLNTGCLDSSRRLRPASLAVKYCSMEEFISPRFFGNFFINWKKLLVEDKPRNDKLKQ